MSFSTKLTIRFAGDSGDGIQMAGQQYAQTAAKAGYTIQTKPSYPAEIRAPAGSLAGVSAYQLQFADHDIYTPGQGCDILVAMNPAALKMHVQDLSESGLLLINEDAFDAKTLEKAGYVENPFADESIASHQLIRVPMTSLLTKALSDTTLSRAQRLKCKNMFALGLVYYLHHQPLETTQMWLREKFKQDENVCDANLIALQAGFAYGEATEQLLPLRQSLNTAPSVAGYYRQITGNDAFAYGAMAASIKAKRPLFVAGYPITPASTLLHAFAQMQDLPVQVVQAEDEIAASAMALGAAYGGHLSLTCTSGPGLDLKTENLGLAVMAEYPMVVINVQRAGPATGMPTKSEQSDLLAAIYGRHGEAPLIVLAPRDQADCFECVYEAFQLAIKYMTPVIILSDAQLAGSSVAWKTPDISNLPAISSDTQSRDAYTRNKNTLARNWVIPGTPKAEYRVGGLEKNIDTGEINYDADNHQAMLTLRAQKIENASYAFPKTIVQGDVDAKLCLIGWGSSFGVIYTAFEQLQQAGIKIAYIHLRYLNPLPKDLGTCLSPYPKALVIEQNLGQLHALLTAKFSRLFEKFARVDNQFSPEHIVVTVKQLLEGGV